MYKKVECDEVIKEKNHVLNTTTGSKHEENSKVDNLEQRDTKNVAFDKWYKHASYNREKCREQCTNKIIKKFQHI